MSYLCEYCNHSYTTKNHLIRHQNTDKCKYIKNLLNKRDQINNEKNNQIQKENELLKKENIILNEEIKNKEYEIKLLQEKYEDLRKIVEKVATKSTTTVKKTYNNNNYLNYISTEPLKISELSKQLKQIVNCETVMYNDEEFHDHIVDNILKDKNGKDKVLCTDINRKNFTYKDETSGELISDPELERLREQLKKGTDIRQIRKDLLDRLVIEYEENGNVGIEPYQKFSEIIKKLNFGSPFLDHVAKKTYIKRCPSLKTKSNESCIENDIIEYTDEEYQELLKEFGDEIV